MDPRVLGAAGIAGVLAAGHFRNRSAGVDQIIVSRTISKGGGPGQLTALVLGKNGARLTDVPSWAPIGPDPLALTPTGGYSVKKVKIGQTVDVLVSAGGHAEAKTLEVTA